MRTHRRVRGEQYGAQTLLAARPLTRWNSQSARLWTQVEHVSQRASNGLSVRAKLVQLASIGRVPTMKSLPGDAIAAQSRRQYAASCFTRFLRQVCYLPFDAYDVEDAHSNRPNNVNY